MDSPVATFAGPVSGSNGCTGGDYLLASNRRLFSWSIAFFGLAVSWGMDFFTADFTASQSSST